jgi:polyribonucleotide nucleotidyltransferase
VEGITLDIMAAALAQAKEGRRAILKAMEVRV